MAKWLFQIDTTGTAVDMGGETMLVIVEEDHFRAEGALKSAHILDDLVADTGLTSLPDALEEIAESMFLSEMEEDALRAMLLASDHFQEEELF